MARRLITLALLLALAGCGSFNFRPAALVVCTSACSFELLPSAPAASAAK